MALTKAKKIELLERQIDAAKDGDPDDFAEWKTTTETVLRHTVGEQVSVLFDVLPHGLCGVAGDVFDIVS